MAPARGGVRPDSAIVWQIRLPRVLLGVLVGSMLAGGGAAYQGIFRNPLADPYLLGVAAGGGWARPSWSCPAAARPCCRRPRSRAPSGAVALTYLLGASAAGARRPHSSLTRSGTGSILLAGIAVAAMLTAFQTYLQQQHTQTLAVRVRLDPRRAVRRDLVGRLADPALRRGLRVALLAHRRLLDVLRGGRGRGGQPRRRTWPGCG